MNSDTASRLLALNDQFYQTFALQFSSTRRRLQPGVRRLLDPMLQSSHILDLGCGNGNLAHALAGGGYQGTYLGLDNSPQLLDQARNDFHASLKTAFLQVDLAGTAWSGVVSRTSAFHDFSPIDLTLAFAVLHHLPGEALRLRVLKEARLLTAPGGRFIHSEWQFLNSPRWRDRIQPWEEVGLALTDVDPEDYLLDWRHGGLGLRYVHHFSLAELDSLAEQSGFSVLETFHSDGDGSRLGLYQVWQAH